eukprot:CAMPEP_0198234030 /NCGR_PEP_ID=MMETSP1446-20131203/124_1 /TAXON_ID=1461542 ORGANISM="Unidentified sp, Strain CCMP2111" /NCGR_SAMPLE_ID=MMETSP1446 /ASSEMBLY_ACC=CAM_ASM_001112 /LENGTH=162 /DNA_ID=CAMNT_0043914753 /DNA_START=190 /DNA_END=678 /DNA_ORIENTATION=-
MKFTKQMLFALAVLALASRIVAESEPVVHEPYYYDSYYYYDDYYYYPYYYYYYYYVPPKSGSTSLATLALHGHNPTVMTELSAETWGPRDASASSYVNGVAVNSRTKSIAAVNAGGNAANIGGVHIAQSNIYEALAENDANVLVKNTAQAAVDKWKKKYMPS